MMLAYELAIRLFGLAIRLGGLFSEKARQWVRGRRHWKSKAAARTKARPEARGKWIWVHCASLGEFEQGRPLIEAIKARDPDQPILLTFFSPSGYEIRKDYPTADLVLYLPLDTRQNARSLLTLFEPRLAIFVKYDLWPNYLRQLDERHIPCLLVSGLFRPGQRYFRRGGGFFRRMLGRVDHFFVQNEESRQLLHAIGIERVTVTGDTRIDRVAEIATRREELPPVSRFCGQAPVLIAGSTWTPDLIVLAGWINDHFPENWKLIVAPHRVEEASLHEVEQRVVLPSIRYSQLQGGAEKQARMLLIDNVGLLSRLYAYGKVAFIGGGFGRSGLHNILEPAVFGLPILFGPHYRGFLEAETLVETGGAFAVREPGELGQIFRRLQDPAAWEEASRAARNYIQQNRGATQHVLEKIMASGWWQPGQ